MKLASNYDPKKIEDKWYRKWEEEKAFHADADSPKEPFTIVIPPPNITGKLHMGHALDETLQDILIRWRRMQGYNALWVPGTDHAAISTEVRVTNTLKEQGIDKREIGREAFLEKVWEWKEEYGGAITEQLRKLGTSCDWDRERFTMDEGCSKAVEKVFLDLYKKGYIYRGKRIINWCPTCKTSLSDAEVEHEDQAGHFWHIRYPIVGTDDAVEIATTRPETMLGDTAIAVHPDDERYKDLVGKTVILPLVNKEIPVVADEYVDMEFGTGVVKITPAHDPNDFEVGQRHDLEVINILNDDATINENGGKYAGMDRYEARKAIVEDLEAGGYLVKVQEHLHAVGTHDRCKTTVEPMVKEQWFVRMDELAKPAIEAIEMGELTFVPERFNKVYLRWLYNIHDWCISRQIWWGHRIPAYYCDECGEIVVSSEKPGKCPKCGCEHLTQDEDTLDTWFSSALWPFSTLGWPEDTKDLRTFYPTSVLVTGYDIIFFWVVRMVFSGYEHTGKSPFHTVLIHGLVRDSLGRKMSKSLGNGIDPLEVIDKYGADALRLTLVTGNAPGNDMRYYDERVEASRNFANKMWNASRFILMNLDGAELERPDDADLLPADKWIMSAANTVARDMTENMDKYELGIAVQKVHDFVWDEFCDWYIEIAKYRIYNRENDPKGAAAALWVLRDTLAKALKLMHPFMPFVTEEIYSVLTGGEDLLMLADWPVYDEALSWPEEEEWMGKVKEMVRGIRNVRSEMDVPPSKKTGILIETSDEDLAGCIDLIKESILPLARATKISRIADGDKTENMVPVVSSGITAYLPLAELVDLDKERERLTKEKERLEKELARSAAMLSNEKFLSKAPEAKVREEKEKQIHYQEMMEQVKKQLENL